MSSLLISLPASFVGGCFMWWGTDYRYNTATECAFQLHQVVNARSRGFGGLSGNATSRTNLRINQLNEEFGLL